MRINARLDNSLIEKFAYIAEKTGQNTSTIVKEAIELYYNSVKKRQMNVKDILEKHHFIASANAEIDLSESYKHYLSSQGNKHDHR